MATPYTLLEKSRLHAFLHQMIKEVNASQKVLKSECDIIKGLLKPWPLKEKIVESENGKDKEINKELIAQPQPETLLSTEEKQALSQVEKILNKARQTLISKKDSESSGVEDTNEKDYKMDHEQIVPPAHITNNQKESLMTTQDHNEPVERNILLKNCNLKLRSDKMVNPKNKSSNTSSSKQSGVTRDVSNKTEVLSFRHRSTPEIDLPTRHRLKSSNRGHVAAHLSAPFKTDPNIKIPKRTKQQPMSQQGQSGRPLSRQSVKNLQVLPSITPEQCEIAPQKVKNNNNSKSNSSDNVNTDKADLALRRDQSAQQLISNTRTMKYSEPAKASQTDKLQEDSGVLASKKAFTLQENGNMLKFPSKLSQLLHKNEKLRQRCSTSKINKKVTEKDAAQQFIDKLEAETEVSQGLWTRVCALTCLRSHKILLETLNNLHLEQVTDNSPNYSIYRAKRILEFILSTFAELQNEVEYFTKTHFPNPPILLKILGQNANEYLDKTEFNVWQTFPEDRSFTLQYHLNLDCKWTDMKFMENYLQLQLSLAELVHQEWSNSLTLGKLDPGLIQEIYGLMTTSGKFLPTFLRKKKIPMHQFSLEVKQ
ncbi:hypothetical protein Btru_019076 [Bulinus truncatus]|nr:hypothetical protein Btru_019076 [Bulinus truncatus]